jgi:hypothetical protein
MVLHNYTFVYERSTEIRNSNGYASGIWNGTLSRFRCLLFFAFIIFALAGCEGNTFEFLADDNSREARIEEALIAIDAGEYARAKAILLALQAEYPNDRVIAGYLSNALAGLAGLDTLNLLETLDQLDATGDTGDIDMVGLVLGDTNGVLTTTEITNKLSDLDSAIDALTDLGTENLTDDQKVQLGLLSLNHAALTIADILAGETSSTEITLTEDGIQDLFNNNTAALSDLSDADDITNKLSSLSEDINNIAGSVDAIATIVGGGSGNDLSDSFSEFQNDVAGDDNVVTESELETFIQTISL